MKKSAIASSLRAGVLLSTLAASTVYAADLPPQMEAILNVIDENCAGNDNGNVYAFDVNKFDAKKAMKEMRASEACEEGREYSVSQSDGVSMALDHILGSGHDAECVKDQIGPREQRKLRELIEDPTNLGVFASTFGSNENSEGCMNFHFEIFRADGVVVRMVFDHTD